MTDSDLLKPARTFLDPYRFLKEAGRGRIVCFHPTALSGSHKDPLDTIEVL